MKKAFIFLPIFFFSVFFYGQGQEFVVSGKVTLNSIGVKDATISVLKLSDNSSGDEDNAENVELVTTTNSSGIFHYSIQPGKYKIKCEYTSPVAVPDELFVTGPEKFELIDKSIEELNFKIVDSIGFIEANAGILEKIPDQVPTVNYKWGKIPIFSEEECKLKVSTFLGMLKGEEGKDVLDGATLGIPLKMFDMTGNIVFYQFPITNLDTRIGYIGVHSVGLNPKESNLFNYPSISLKELNDRLIEFRSMNFLMDSRIPDMRRRTAAKLGVDPGELMFKRFLSLGPDSFSFYIVFNKFPDEKEIIVDMNDYSILSEEKTTEQICDESEARYILKYILDLKSEK